VSAGDTHLTPITAKERRKLDERTKKKYDRFGRRYPETKLSFAFSRFRGLLNSGCALRQFDPSHATASSDERIQEPQLSTKETFELSLADSDKGTTGGGEIVAGVFQDLGHNGEVEKNGE
jgi:hypothetical protein